MEDYKKKYEEALKTAKVLMDNSDDKISKKKIEEIFPELRESEDERIREKVIEVLKFNIDGAESQMQASRGVDRTFEVYACNKVISWLEKQGKVKHTCRNCQTFQNLQQNCPYSPIYQYTDLKESHNHLDDETHCKFWVEKQGEEEPSDKVEPKFKVGDWITNNCAVWCIENIHDGLYDLKGPNGGVMKNAKSKLIIDTNFHLWTINDAKNGDILQLGNVTAIFMELIDNNNCKCHCSVCKGIFEIPSQKGDDNSYGCHHDSPATKEQRDLLFSKMKEAGYEWDAEKKELKKIESVQPELPNGEDYGIDSLYHAARILEKTLGDVEGYQSDDGILEHKCAIEAVNRLYKQKPAWSEEDEKFLNLSLVNLTELKNRFGEKYGKVGDCIHWLKSLKSHTKPVEWSEQDDDMLLEISSNLLYAAKNRPTCNMEIYKDELDWLKRICKK